MQVKVYTILTVHEQTRLSKAKLLKEWQESARNKHPAHFTPPSDEDIDAERNNFPLQVFRHTGQVLAYVTGGEHEDFGPIAVIQKEDRFLSEEPITNLQVMTNQEMLEL